MTTIETERLAMRASRDADVSDALAIYGGEEVTRWLNAVMGRVLNVEAVSELLQRWQFEDAAPTGH